MMVRAPSTPEEVELLVRRMSVALAEPVDDGVIKAVAEDLEREFSVLLGKSHTLKTDEHQPWLLARKHEIDFRYWKRYREFLLMQGYGPHVVNALSDVTDQILDMAGDPQVPPQWSRRGLVVGHVQSGKTANYLGLINKAADAGYKLIVLIAGIHSNLRSQTQERVDQGFVGRDSEHILTDKKHEKALGVGRIDPGLSSAAFTSRGADFSLARADGLNVSLDSLNVPAIFVIKKNPSILRNLVAWLRGTSHGGQLDLPMLVIDDEADNASVNVASDPNRPTTINSLIRELLKLSTRNTYVGYTATPFANIFIDPDRTDEMLGDDLFPRHFLVGLDAPTNYVGAREFFLEEDERLTISLEDTEDWLPSSHRISAEVDDLHPTLEEAMDCFILSKAIRILRRQGARHHSMLVNVSRFTRVQGEVAKQLKSRLQVMKNAIENRYAAPVERALSDPAIRALHDSWEKHYADEPETWVDVQKSLHQAAAGMVVVEINSGASAGKLDYKAHEKTGLNVIAVGGNSLSRGFTLEGLTVSYFLRNTQMYDTLLQMGRWFGYRDGYGSLCRLFIKPEARDWYAFIAEASEELRDEIRKMEAAGLTPEHFGLAVRSHPGTLLITARNKMGTAHEVVRQVGLANRLVETTVIHGSEDPRKFNWDHSSRWVGALVTQGKQWERTDSKRDTSHALFRNVSMDSVLDFISGFAVSPGTPDMQAGPLSEYIRERGFKEWDVVVLSNSQAEGEDIKDLGGIRIGMQDRAMVRHKTVLHVSGNNRRVASRGAERVGLDDDQVAAAKQAHKDDPKAGKTMSDRFYREQRTRPLLMLHFLKGVKPADSRDGTIAGQLHAAYGISFPALRQGEQEKRVAYTVGLVGYRQIYGELDAAGDEDDERDDE